LLLFIIVPHRLVLYAQRSAPDLLVLGVLLLLIIERAFHHGYTKNSSASYEENPVMQIF